MNTIGSKYLGNGSSSFAVWAPQKQKMTLHLVHPRDQKIEMYKNEEGYFSIEVQNTYPGTRYFFMPDEERDYPDPASNYQPEGVHGPSEVIDHTTYQWRDNEWKGKALNRLIFYELHVGTFTKEGTFEATISRLDDLVEVGINAIELMPVNQFPGDRNWGYDGVFPYAVQNSYGGPEELKKLIDACHLKGISVFLDVVYNHLGPEGNYFNQYGPYFTDQYKTPWGNAINFDGQWSDGVREFFSNNPLYWFEHFHIDGLRADAIHMIYDNGAVHFWELVYQKIKESEERKGRSFFMIAESDLNSPKVVKLPDQGGYGFNAQWLDDFHHALYVMLDKKGKKRYYDFGKMEQLAKAYKDGFVHSGEYVQFRKRKHGRSSADISGDKFVVFNQNHDQIGNRVGGERLCMLVDFERQKLAAAAILLAPYIPMLFMGEEYSDESPFFYFISHSDKELIKAVQEGRKEEFKDFKGEGEPADPQSEKTFMDSKIKWEKRKQGKHLKILKWHKKLIELRFTYPAFLNFNKSDLKVETIDQDGFVLYRNTEEKQQHVACLFNLSEKEISYQPPSWMDKAKKILDSKDIRWLEQDMTINPLPDLIEGQELMLPSLSVTVYLTV